MKHHTNLKSRKSESAMYGDLSEERVLCILKTFISVSEARRDRYNSKFDIYYELKGEDFTRGLQVKTIIQPYSDTYQLGGLYKYEVGMLIVGINYPNFGILHIVDELDKDNVTSYLSLTRREKTKLEKEILMWSDFLVELEKSLTQGIIVTPEIFKKSVSPMFYREYESIERFKIFCVNHGLKLEEVYNVSSPTDLIVNGFKVQMKYRSQSKNYAVEGIKHYSFAFRRTGKVKYIRGDNDFYVLELGNYHGDFLWIPDYLLVEKGYISKGPLEKEEKSLCIFPYDYVEKRRENVTTTQKNRHQIKGNWSCNRRYWISTTRGCLGSTNDVAIHIENLLIEEWIDSPYEPNYI